MKDNVDDDDDNNERIIVLFRKRMEKRTFLIFYEIFYRTFIFLFHSLKLILFVKLIIMMEEKFFH